MILSSGPPLFNCYFPNQAQVFVPFIILCSFPKLTAQWNLFTLCNSLLISFLPFFPIPYSIIGSLFSAFSNSSMLLCKYSTSFFLPSRTHSSTAIKLLSCWSFFWHNLFSDARLHASSTSLLFCLAFGLLYDSNSISDYRRRTCVHCFSKTLLNPTWLYFSPSPCILHSDNLLYASIFYFICFPRYLYYCPFSTFTICPFGITLPWFPSSLPRSIFYQTHFSIPNYISPSFEKGWTLCTKLLTCFLFLGWNRFIHKKTSWFLWPYPFPKS